MTIIKVVVAEGLKVLLNEPVNITMTSKLFMSLETYKKAVRLQFFRNRPDEQLSYNRIWLPSLGTRGQGV